MNAFTPGALCIAGCLNIKIETIVIFGNKSYLLKYMFYIYLGVWMEACFGKLGLIWKELLVMSLFSLLYLLALTSEGEDAEGRTVSGWRKSWGSLAAKAHGLGYNFSF